MLNIVNITEREHNTVEVSVKGICGPSKQVLPMSAHEFKERQETYNAGAYVQDAFDNLSADEREFLLTGLTKEQWDALWGEET